MIETLVFSDLKLSLRQLKRTPGFSVAAVMVLALGIGLNAAMFGLSYSISFAGRPFEKPEELMQLYSRNANEPDSYRPFSYGAFEQIASQNGVFSGVLAHKLGLVGLNEQERGGEARRTFAALVSANYFNVLGVSLPQGRSFTAEEGRAGSEIPVAVASYALWKRTGFDPKLLGRTIRVNERPFTVVGISPRGFTGTMSMFGPEIFFPLGVYDSLSNDTEEKAIRSLQKTDVFKLFLVGRLKPGMTRENVEQVLKVTSPALERAFPKDYKGQELSIFPLPRLVTSPNPAPEAALITLSIVLLGMTGSVLLIVCLNLASMLLARGQARRREFAIRLALGGGRGRIVRQLLTEGLLLSLLGGSLGIVFGLLAVDALIGALMQRLPVSLAIDAATSPAIVGSTAFFSVLATLLFSLGPAMRHTGASVIGELKQQAGETASTRRNRFLPRHPLVALQISLSLCLLISAGLFLQMARQASDVEKGFRTNETVVIGVDASLGGYRETEGLSLLGSIEERLRGLPGVASASVGSTIPFGTVSNGEMVRRAGVQPAPDTKPQTPAEGQSFGSSWNSVGAQYFDAMGISRRSGRAFTDAESRQEGSSRVAIIDDVLARKLWPDGSALGRSIEFEKFDSTTAQSEPMEVVGIVSVIRDDFLEKTPGGAVYVPFAQGYRGSVYFHVRPVHGAVRAVQDAVQRAIQSSTPGLPRLRATTFADHVSSSLEFWTLKTMVSVFAAMGLIATLIAFVGIYGAKSYAVSRRTREIGIRLAIGATPTAVRHMILNEGLALGASGVGFGLLLGVGMGRVLDSVFVEVGAFDPMTFTLAPLLLLAACVVAAWFPARRATTVNPVTALRSE